MSHVFVSDLHLSAERPDKLALFTAFAARVQRTARALYVLGDLFEVWLGDDDDTPAHRAVLEALSAVSAAGVTVGFMPGNRDFLCGAGFAVRSGATLLPDYALIDLDGRRALLTHGDLLCTNDVKYQRFRRVVRNPIVQRAFLSTPLAWRRRIAAGTQSRTRASMTRKAAPIMDVEPSAVVAALSTYGVDLLVHGHTHRPGVHEIDIDGHRCERVVLGDWYEQDNVVVYRGGRLESLRVREYLAG